MSGLLQWAALKLPKSRTSHVCSEPAKVYSLCWTLSRLTQATSTLPDAMQGTHAINRHCGAMACISTRRVEGALA